MSNQMPTGESPGLSNAARFVEVEELKKVYAAGFAAGKEAAAIAALKMVEYSASPSWNDCARECAAAIRALKPEDGQ